MPTLPSLPSLPNILPRQKTTGESGEDEDEDEGEQDDRNDMHDNNEGDQQASLSPSSSPSSPRSPSFSASSSPTSKSPKKMDQILVHEAVRGVIIPSDHTKRRRRKNLSLDLPPSFIAKQLQQQHQHLDDEERKASSLTSSSSSSLELSPLPRYDSSIDPPSMMSMSIAEGDESSSRPPSPSHLTPNFASLMMAQEKWADNMYSAAIFDEDDDANGDEADENDEEKEDMMEQGGMDAAMPPSLLPVAIPIPPESESKIDSFDAMNQPDQVSISPRHLPPRPSEPSLSIHDQLRQLLGTQNSAIQIIDTVPTVGAEEQHHEMHHLPGHSPAPLPAASSSSFHALRSPSPSSSPDSSSSPPPVIVCPLQVGRSIQEIVTPPKELIQLGRIEYILRFLFPPMRLLSSNAIDGAIYLKFSQALILLVACMTLLCSSVLIPIHESQSVKDKN